MALSVTILALIVCLHTMAFIFAVGAERRRSTAKVVPDQYDERTYCLYTKDASTLYGGAAFALLLLSQLVVTMTTKCLCLGKGLVEGRSSCAIFSCVASWVCFLGAEACLVAASVRNAYHTKYRGVFKSVNPSCATIRKGVFAAAGVLILLTLVWSVVYYWAHRRADTGGWEKHRNEERQQELREVEEYQKP